MLEVFGNLNACDIIGAENIDVEGKVVIVGFWSSSRLDCFDDISFLKELRKVSGDDLLILGVHTPEFNFEKDPDYLRCETVRLEINYPVIADSDYYVWSYFNNLTWPSIYIFDRSGQLTYENSGIEDYREILELLAGLTGNQAEIVTSQVKRSPEVSEVYLGSLRGKIGKQPHNSNDRSNSYILPDVLDEGELYLEGSWFTEDEYAVPDSENSSISLVFLGEKAGIVLSKVNVRGLHYFVDGKDSVVIPDRSGLHILFSSENPGRHVMKILPGKGVECYKISYG
jgi:thiol-disulfide isomerase/thioredoxin